MNDDNNPNPAQEPTPQPSPDQTIPVAPTPDPVQMSSVEDPEKTNAGVPPTAPVNSSGGNKKPKFSKKVLLISIGAVLLLAGAAFGVLYFVAYPPNSSEADPYATTQIVQAPDTLNACTFLEASIAKELLGVSTLQDATETKVGQIEEGDYYQSCVYPFGDSGELPAADNAFSIQKYVFINQTVKNGVTKFISNESKVDSTVSDLVVYTWSQNLTAVSVQFSLTIYKDLNQFTFTISQLSDGLTFDETIAKTTLVALAEAANLD